MGLECKFWQICGRNHCSRFVKDLRCHLKFLHLQFLRILL
jgi:hypothetical protein